MSAAVSDSILSTQLPGSRTNLWLALGAAAAVYIIFVRPMVNEQIKTIRKIDGPRRAVDTLAKFRANAKRRGRP